MLAIEDRDPLKRNTLLENERAFAVTKILLQQQIEQKSKVYELFGLCKAIIG